MSPDPQFIIQSAARGIFKTLLIPYSPVSIGEGNGNPLQVLLPREPYGQRRPGGLPLWGCTESDMTEAT